jgi:hypothetical protein
LVVQTCNLSTFTKLRQEDPEFKVCLSYIARLLRETDRQTERLTSVI